jgi:Ca2+-binding EF-hand superfamily protein
MSNSFLNRKYKTLFNIHDVERKGEISEADHNKYIENMIALGHMKSDRAQLVLDTNKKVWNDYFLPGDSNGDGIVSYEEFSTHMNVNLNLNF